MAVLLILGLPLVAFFWGRPEPLPSADFTFILPKENSTLDPAHASSVSDGWTIQALFEGLVRLDPETLEVIPGTSERFESSDDARRFTFHLRPGLRWSDGNPLTAHDHVFGMRRLLDPHTASPNAFLFHVIEGARNFEGGDDPLPGVHAPDDHTVVFQLEGACSYFPSLLAHFSAMPVREDLVQQHSDRWTDPSVLVGNGPYDIRLRRVRDRLRLEKNREYWNQENVFLHVVDALAVDSRATALNLYLTGSADWVNGIPAAAVPHLKGRDDLFLSPTFATNFLRFNVTEPPLNDVRVRRAIDLALDRDELCRYVLRRGDQPARSFVPPALPGYTPATAPDESVTRSRELLAEAGYPGGEGFPELEFLHAADETARAVAETIAARLRETLGIQLRPMPQEHKVYLDSQRNLKYQVCLASWYGDYPDPSTFLDLFQTGESGNRTGYSNSAYDALIKEARSIADPILRASVLRDAEALLLMDGPIAPLSFRSQPNLVNPDITGFNTNLLDLHPLERLRWRTP